jgi:hypothetical protein
MEYLAKMKSTLKLNPSTLTLIMIHHPDTLESHKSKPRIENRHLEKIHQNKFHLEMMTPRMLANLETLSSPRMKREIEIDRKNKNTNFPT